jgi:glycosyltransferase involved in cell wall biosynthesis
MTAIPTARAEVGIDAGATVLLYVGVLDRTHDLEPLLQALAASRPRGVELHIVGEGVKRPEYEALVAAHGVPVKFHGRVPHEAVPRYIAAADLCVAPYDASAFSSGELGYSTMKIPEYLGVGRPVASVPSGRIRTLIAEGRTGFLFPNEVVRWKDFLDRLPDRARLREMGREAGRTHLPSWQDTAKNYLELCVRHLGRLESKGR